MGRERTKLQPEKNRESEDGARRGRHIRKHTNLSASSEERIKWNNSHVEAKILLLLEEVVQDVFPHKVWV